MVVGHSPGYLYNPDQVGNVLMVRSGDWGQYAGLLKIDITTDGKMIGWEGAIEPLSGAMPSDSLLERELVELQHTLGDAGWTRH